MQKRGSTLFGGSSEIFGSMHDWSTDGFSFYAFLRFLRHDMRAGIFSIRSPCNGVCVSPGTDLVIPHR